MDKRKRSKRNLSSGVRAAVAPDVSAEALRKDAERYRYLRRQIMTKGEPFICIESAAGFSRFTEEYADAAIDAAIDDLANG